MTLRRTHFISAVFLFLILLFAGLIRTPTFWMPHWQGDQHQYVALAMKLNEFGIRGYNLRGVGIRYFPLRANPEIRLVAPEPLPSDEEGDLFKIYKMAGVDYYNMPVFYKAPFFPAVLVVSHWFLLGPAKPFFVVHTNLHEKPGTPVPSGIIQAQLWATIVPWLSSLLTVLGVFFLGRKIAGIRTGLYAALLMAMHPVDIVASQKILTDDLAMLLVLLSVLAFLRFYEKGVRLGVWFAGVLGGYAVMTNQKAFLIVPAIWACTFLSERCVGSPVKAWLRRAVNPRFLLYLFGVLFISFQWFDYMHSTYRDYFYQSTAPEHTKDVMGWFELVRSRPGALVLFAVGIPYICPLFLAAYFTLGRFAAEWKGIASNKSGRPYTVFLWLWVLSYLVYYQIVGRGLEHRYMLPAYPALAVLAATTLERLRQWIHARVVQSYAGDLALAVLFLAALGWSLPMAMDTVLHDRFLILKPF